MRVAFVLMLLAAAPPPTSIVSPAAAQFLLVTGGPTRLQVGPPAVAGADPQPDEDESTRLLWLFAPRQTSKITIATVSPGQSFLLYAEARNVGSATAMPEVLLSDGNRSQDFIRDIRRNMLIGWATVYFRAEAPASLGNSALRGNDEHTVFFTMTEQ